MSKIAFSIQYAGLTLPVTQNEQGQDVTPLKPIADLFGLKWETQREKVSANTALRDYLGVCITPLKGGDQREQLSIRIDRVAAYLMGINPSRVLTNGNTDGYRYLVEKQEEWADALHDYEEIGVAVNLKHIKTQETLRRQRASFAQMIGIKNKTTNRSDRAALAHVAKAMAAELGVPYQIDLTETAEK